MTNITTVMTITPTATTMTSREIAELTGKEHKNVLVDIRTMLDGLVMTSAEFSANLPDTYGRSQPGYRLPKRETLILVSGYSVAMRAKIIDRWQELEGQAAAPALPRNYAEALRHAADSFERAEAMTQQLAITSAAVAALESQVAIAAPKLDVYDAVVADKLMTVPAFGMLLAGVNTQSMHKDLIRMGYLRRTSKGLSAPSQYRDTLFKLSICPVYGKTTVRILDKGKEELTKLWKAGRLTMRASHWKAIDLAASAHALH